ncbi:MAG: hypothetical protein ACEPO8_14695 [Rhodothermaceae bacterium]
MKSQFSDIKISKKFKLKGNKNGTQSIFKPVPRPQHGSDIDFDIYDLEMIFNDPATKELLRKGETIGCFYVESPGMRSLLKQLECDTFEMLTAASSVIRPGVAESGMMQEFIKRHKDPSRRKYLIPEMKKYLGETYGVMIYQEDVIKIAHHIIGLTLEEADLLRRAMSGKMRSHKAMQAISDRFQECCKQKNFSFYVQKKLWEQISSFAGYAFCKAHSASFAVLSFQVTYLKAHYPAEFMANVLSNRGGFYSAPVYIWEAVRIGIKLKLPCINNSQYIYTGKQKEIQIGLMAVKGLTHNTGKKIISEREKTGKYISLADFINRVNPGYEETILLIRCGALGCFRQTRPELLRLLDVYFRHRTLVQNGDLFHFEISDLEEKVKTAKQFTIEEICRNENELLGYMVTRHPLQFYKDYINRNDVVPATEMENYHNQTIKMIGWYMTSKRIKTKKNKIMKFLSLEDLTGTFEAVVFPDVYQKYAELTMSMGPYLIEGRVDIENGNNLVVEKLEILSAVDALVVTQKDSTENKWYGEREIVHEEEFKIVKTLDQKKMVQYYTGAKSG